MKLTTATILAAALFAAPACKKKSNTKVVDPGDTTGSSDRTDRDSGDVDRSTDDGSMTRVSGDDGESPLAFAAIYFEFDSSTLGDDARGDLQRLAEWLSAHPEARITIEGHCDERGTDEYNIALGQKRAQVILDYLGRLGVERARLNTISYGEERPASTGDSEQAWALNRRGEFVEAP
jgi:peptidoglycan-associated lipoprotein